MRNPFKTNKGLVDHCVGGVLGSDISVAVYRFADWYWSLVLMIIAFSLSAIAVELYQLKFERLYHSNFKKDSMEDLIGEFGCGMLTLYPLLISDNNVLVIVFLMCSLWLTYSYKFRWRK